MDGGFYKVFHGIICAQINHQPIISMAELPHILMGGGIIYHNKKFIASLNMWGRKKLLAPLNGKGHNLI